MANQPSTAQRADAPPPPGALALAAASIDNDEGFPVGRDGLACPYWDGIGKVWTIGTGLTRLNGRAVTQETAAITRVENDRAVDTELGVTESLIAAVVTAKLAPCEWAALANWMFNVGGHAAATSTLLRKLNTGDKTGACQQFLAWVMADGKVIAGLRNRRLRTMALFSGQAVPGVTDRAGMPSAAARRAVPGVTPLPAAKLVATITPTPPVAQPKQDAATQAVCADTLMADELVGDPTAGLLDDAAILQTEQE